MDGDRPGDAIAGIDDDAQGLSEVDLLRDVAHVVVDDITMFEATGRVGVAERARLGEGVEGLDVGRAQGDAVREAGLALTCLEAIELGWVVTCGDASAAIGMEGIDGEVEEGGWHLADVDDVGAGAAQAIDEGGGVAL